MKKLREVAGGIGLPTGKKSGIVVLDVDVDDGGLESLAKLERAGAPVLKTARTRTGGGGIHVFFRYPGSTEIRNSAGLLGPGLDIRGEGATSWCRPAARRVLTSGSTVRPSPRHGG